MNTSDIVRLVPTNGITRFTRLYVVMLLLWSFGIAALGLNPYNIEHMRTADLIAGFVAVGGFVAFVSAVPMLAVAVVAFIVLGGLK